MPSHTLPYRFREGAARRCSRCRERKLFAEYHYPPGLKGQPNARCKSCVLEVAKERRAANRALLATQRRVRYLRNKYAMTLADFDAKVRAQRGKCAACGKPETAKIRGVVRALGVHMPEPGGVWDLRCFRCQHVNHYQRMSGGDR